MKGVTAATVRQHCRTKAGVTEEWPFGPDVLVMKVCGKVFALIDDDGEPDTVSVKCEPELAVALRESYPAVTAGYHLNKRHWNTVALDGSVTAGEVLAWVDDSYDLVVDGLPKRVQATLT